MPDDLYCQCCGDDVDQETSRECPRCERRLCLDCYATPEGEYCADCKAELTPVVSCGAGFEQPTDPPSCGPDE